MPEASFKIYDASAGSGKTFSLVKEYLKIILSAPQYNSHRQILAITFTNKAANEMKQRILDGLYQIGRASELNETPPMFHLLKDELQLTSETLQQRAKKSLKEILHNYAFFDISTIDKFTHRLIRSFAKDLKLPQNFEVVLDLDLLLDEAISKLLNKAGTDTTLTNILIDFATEKIDDDKSWDLSWDLKKIGKLLFQENHGPHLEYLKDKKLDEFVQLKVQIQKKMVQHAKNMVHQASVALTLIDENGLEHSDFISGYFPKFMLKIQQKDLNINFDAGWKQHFSTKSLYAKSCLEHTKQTLDKLHPELIAIFDTIKTNFYRHAFLRNVYSNLLPLTLMNAIKTELKVIEEERDILPISSFNTIISKEIRDQPTPFIYERLGEKYRYYFVDEFQDTSELQWKNLIPLVTNALESEDFSGNTGALLLVGDAKQAIYRWRGGKAEQFLNLISTTENPFVVPPNIAILDTNRRSSENIVNFNNSFFENIAPLFTDTKYQELYKQGKQFCNNQKGGFVQLSFIAKDSDDIDLSYCESVLHTVEEVQKKGYRFEDICVLTRTRKHGILIANFLMQNNIKIISSETLLLRTNPKIEFLINLLQYAIQPDDLSIAYKLLYFLATDLEHKHSFVHENLHQFDAFVKKAYAFNSTSLQRLSVFDGMEIAIKQFQLLNGADAYITYFMDLIWEVEQREGTAIHNFLAYWETKKDTASIAAPDNMDAIRIMTIHKSKGLEFPIVIFPYADAPMYREIDPKVWLPTEQQDSLSDFKEVLVSKKQDMVYYSQVAQTIFQEDQNKLELDAFNIIYVALTRAREGLYIISKKDLNTKGSAKMDYYSGLFINYLQEKQLWNDSQTTYTFGNLNTASHVKSLTYTEQPISYKYTYKNRASFEIISTPGALWGSEKERALLAGNRIHLVLEKIKSEKDVDITFQQLITAGLLVREEVPSIKDRILQVLHHPELSLYYTEDATILNEQEIITKNGVLLRPDRIVIKNHKATIIDYKTGLKNKTHKQQLFQYADALEAMGYKVENKILIYIRDTVIPEFI